MTAACSIRVRGVVQGVGFRPFVYRLAHANTLAGWVLNGDEGVEIHLEGERARLDAFLEELRSGAPAAATITAVEVDEAVPSGLGEFVIRSSSPRAQPTTGISPDLAVCQRCLRELFDCPDPRHSIPTSTAPIAGPATPSSAGSRTTAGRRRWTPGRWTSRVRANTTTPTAAGSTRSRWPVLPADRPTCCGRGRDRGA